MTEEKRQKYGTDRDRKPFGKAKRRVWKRSSRFTV